jgi:hypothetical protein
MDGEETGGGMNGEETGDGINGEIPEAPKLPDAFRTYYVAGSGKDWYNGTSEVPPPLQTVEAALGKLATDYTQEDWPDKGDPKEGFGEIIIRGEATASSTILIEGPGYPSIVLRGESGSESKLVGNMNSGYLLTIRDGAKVTLEDGLTLTRSASNGALVYVYKGTFIMNGGEIAGNSAHNYGGGVFVGYNSLFTMNGGKIAGNSAVGSGGGVYISDIFVKAHGGIIYGANESANANTVADGLGHAVCISGGKKRDATAGADVLLISLLDGTDGGWDYQGMAVTGRRASPLLRALLFGSVPKREPCSVRFGTDSHFRTFLRVFVENPVMRHFKK